MNNVGFADILFIVLVFGVIYGCLFLARRAGKKNTPPAEDKES